ncbi:MAG: PEFG-CTERM sorting domain-containing protein [Nitrosopumilus sp.]|nr:PEFG-CTERM sorting domain-containing protein [Nitrosopumilus sp.]
MNKQDKLTFFGLMTLVLVSGVPLVFSAGLGDDWNSIKSSLSDGEKALTVTDSLSHVGDAQSIYVSSFKNAAVKVDVESDTLIETAFKDIKTNHSSGDVEKASLNRQIIDKTIYKIAFMKMESAIEKNDSIEFLNWYDVMEKKFKISEKEYTANSLLAQIKSDNSLLSTNSPAITKELLGIFKLKTIEELEEAIAALDEGNIKDAKKFTYEGLYYYRTLHPSIEEKLGAETANKLLHEMEEAIEVTMSGKSAQEMKVKMEHILEEAELIIREYEGGNTSETGLALSGIKDRLSLVEVEYTDAVKDGKIVDQEEYDETVVFLAKATEIFNQNKMTFKELSDSDTLSLENNLKEIDKVVTSKDNPNKVSILVGKGINSIATLENLAGGSVQTDTVEHIVEIERLLNEAKKEYRAGNTQIAFDLVSQAYLDNYEFVEGPLGEVDHDLMEKIEIDMREELRNMIKSNASPDSVDNQIDMILIDLTEAKKIVPEFGTIALLVLFVAVASIIVLSRGRNVLLLNKMQ